MGAGRGVWGRHDHLDKSHAASHLLHCSTVSEHLSGGMAWAIDGRDQLGEGMQCVDTPSSHEKKIGPTNPFDCFGPRVKMPVEKPQCETPRVREDHDPPVRLLSKN